MKKVKINYKDEVHIGLLPESLKEMTLDKFQKIQLIIDSNEFKSLNEKQRLVTLLSILMDLPEHIIKKISLERLLELNAVISWIADMQKLILDIKSDLLIDIDGKSYGFDYMMKGVDLGQFIDWDLFSLENKGEFWQNIHKISAIFIRPATTLNWFERFWYMHTLRRKGINMATVKAISKFKLEQYDSDTVNERAILFKDKLPMDLIYSVAVFFCALSSQFNKTIQSSLKNQTQKKKWKIPFIKREKAQ